MPKFSFDEEVMRDWVSDDEAEVAKIEAEIAQMRREPNGQLSEYKAAQCRLNEDKFRETGRLTLQELRGLGATKIFVDYNGGGDEGFAELDGVQTTDSYLSLSRLSEKLQDGPLGDAPAPVAQPDPRYPSHIPVHRTRAEWTQFRIEALADELAQQLLGRGFGTGEYSLEGAFVADLESNTLTDIAPPENA